MLLGGTVGEMESEEYLGISPKMKTTLGGNKAKRHLKNQPSKPNLTNI